MVNRQNYIWVRAYLAHLANHRQLDPKSVQRYWFYLRHLLLWALEKPLFDVHRIDPSFAHYLSRYKNDGQSLSHVTMKKIIATTQRLFRWLKSNYQREFRQLPEGWVDTLSAPKKTVAIHEHSYVSLDYVRQITSLSIESQDLAGHRDQAAAAFLFLSGTRNSAVTSLPISCVNIQGRAIRQDPGAGVRTKNGKSCVTYLLDIPELLLVANSWHDYIASQLPPTAMWYTPVTGSWGNQELSADAPGLNRHVALGRRLRLLSARAGLPSLSPHKYRHGHAVYALQRAKNMADYKAISQNLMHEDISITDGIYAPLVGHEVEQRIAGLGQKPSGDPQYAAINLPDVNDPELNSALLMIARRLIQNQA